MSETQIYDFFISYPGDDYDFATKLHCSLSRLGQTVFLDTHCLAPGSRFAEDIPEAIENSRILAIIVTERTENSFYVQAEIDRGLNLLRRGKLLIVPICVDNAKPTFGLESIVPIKCTNSQHDRVAIELFVTYGKNARRMEQAYQSSISGNRVESEEIIKCEPQSLPDSLFWSDRKMEVEKPAETPWAFAAWNSPLWPIGSEPSLLRALCVKAAIHAERQNEIRRDDAWFDSTYPLRVLDMCAELARQLGVDLNSAEAALVTYSVFYCEASYGTAFQAISQGLPLLYDTNHTTTVAHPDAIRLVIAAYHARPLLARRLKQLRESGDENGQNAIESWLVHRAVARFPGRWDVRSGTLPDLSLPEQEELQSSEVDSRHVPLAMLFQRDRLRKLARCVRCDPERILGDRWGDTYELAISIGEQLPPIRERLIGGLLCVAGWMALDIRSMDDTLAEHIGTNGGFPPQEVCKFIRDCKWQRVGGSMSIHGKCPHPIADRTVEVLVQQSQSAIANFAAIVDKGTLGLKEVELLARQLTHDIRPSGEPNHVPYSRPHLQFQLSAGEIRELLLEKKLYRDSDAAIRELYQNALDACRYADARNRYLKRVGKPRSWTGRISFRQGVDANTKRRFLECQDNGIGMGTRELTSCFATAGKRFADLPEFVEEQELWRKLDPPIELHPNSQFGIGVFSYFMIADEIRVNSCRMSEDGHPGARLSVYIPGSGSLFQLQELEPGIETGTTVRLYLRDDWEGDCVEALNRWLVIAEYETRATNETVRSESIHQAFVPKLDVCCVGNPERTFWWINAHTQSQFYKSGEVLSDGIRVKDAPGDFNYFINLVGKDRKALTVNRSHFVEDIPPQFCNDWVAQNIEYIVQLTAIDFAWLWALSRKSKANAEKARIVLSAKNKYLPLRLQPPYIMNQKRFPVSDIGVCESDDELLVRLNSSFRVEVISKPIRQSWPIEKVGQIQGSAITASMF